MLGLFAFLALSVLNSPKTRIVIRETLLMAPEAAFYRLDLPAPFSVVIGRGAMDLINIRDHICARARQLILWIGTQRKGKHHGNFNDARLAGDL